MTVISFRVCGSASTISADLVGHVLIVTITQKKEKRLYFTEERKEDSAYKVGQITERKSDTLIQGE